MIKDSDRELLKVPGIIVLQAGKFLAKSLREPVEYALDEISAKGSKGFKTALIGPGTALSLALAVGIIRKSWVLGVSAGVLTWSVIGIRQRIRWLKDHG